MSIINSGGDLHLLVINVLLGYGRSIFYIEPAAATIKLACDLYGAIEITEEGAKLTIWHYQRYFKTSCAASGSFKILKLESQWLQKSADKTCSEIKQVATEVIRTIKLNTLDEKKPKRMPSKETMKKHWAKYRKKSWA